MSRTNSSDVEMQDFQTWACTLLAVGGRRRGYKHNKNRKSIVNNHIQYTTSKKERIKRKKLLVLS